MMFDSLSGSGGGLTLDNLLVRVGSTVQEPLTEQPLSVQVEEESNDKQRSSSHQNLYSHLC
jgi:hypothetical protein